MNRETIKASTRATLTASHGIDFAADFHTLSQSQACALADAARAHGYRKPRNANGSTARYFFAYLTRTPKTELQHVIQGYYGHGWEDECCSTVRREALADLKAYRENCPEFPHRIIARRERIAA
jgi:hypothetical protein